MSMKAISLKQPFGTLIQLGYKTYETRTWATSYRGDLLICSSLKPYNSVSNIMNLEQYLKLSQIHDNQLLGCALCVVKIIDCVKLEQGMEDKTWCEFYDGFAWKLSNLRKIVPFNLKAKGIRASQGFYDVPNELIHIKSN